MIKTFLCRVKFFIADCLSAVKQNKIIVIAVSALCLFGALIALTAESGDETNANFIIAVISDNKNPVLYILLITFITAAIQCSVFIASFHFITFIGIFCVPYAASYFIFKAAFISVGMMVVPGLFYILIYLLPVFIVNGFCFCLNMAFIYSITGYGYNKRRCNNVSCFAKPIAGKIARRLICCLIFNLALYLFIYFVLILIF